MPFATVQDVIAAHADQDIISCPAHQHVVAVILVFQRFHSKREAFQFFRTHRMDGVQDRFGSAVRMDETG